MFKCTHKLFCACSSEFSSQITNHVIVIESDYHTLTVIVRFSAYTVMLKIANIPVVSSGNDFIGNIFFIHRKNTRNYFANVHKRNCQAFVNCASTVIVTGSATIAAVATTAFIAVITYIRYVNWHVLSFLIN